MKTDGKRIRRFSVFISYLIGVPVSLITIAFFFVLPSAISGEGLPTMGIVAMYGKAIAGLYISFLLSLWIFARDIPGNLEKDATLLRTSWRFSYSVNLIIWLTFIIVTILSNIRDLSLIFILPPVIAFLFCTIGTTFTVGLLICYLIRNKLKLLP